MHLAFYPEKIVYFLGMLHDSSLGRRSGSKASGSFAVNVKALSTSSLSYPFLNALGNTANVDGVAATVFEKLVYILCHGLRCEPLVQKATPENGFDWNDRHVQCTEVR
jgi:hypothetical protein